jgi:gliding motility-associated-like protein
MNNIATTTYTFTTDVGDCLTDPAQMTVIVNPSKTPTFISVAPICSGAALSDLPTRSANNISGTWLPAMNNMATTTYTFTPDASETCAEATTLEISVNPIIIPIFTQVDAICSGAALSDLPTRSTNNISGIWSPAMNNMATTTYTFTPDVSEICVEIITLEIAVNPIIIPIFTQVDAICSGAAFSDLPTTSNNGVLGGWSPAMNNTLTTTYTFIPDLSETCALNQRMTITVNQTVIPIFDPVAAICEGELLTNLPTTSKNGVLGGWSPAMNNMATTTYTFTPDASEICAEITTLEIGVHEIINSNLDVRIVVNKLDYNQSVEVDVANAVGFYEYKLDSGLWQDSNLFENLIVGKHSIAAREKSGCNMELTIWFLLIDYPRFFTPNGDGINDTWNVKGLESQPEAVITIFDRFGKILSVFKADELGWNGIWNGKSARSNSYWFKVSYFEMEDRPKTVMLSFSLFR